MKCLFTLAAVLMLSVTAFATDLARVPFPILSGPNSPAAIQFLAPDGTLTKLTTVASQYVDLRGYIIYTIWSASGTCFERATPANNTKGAFISTPVPNTAWHTRAVNANTPFLNVTGCVGGYIKIQ